MNLLNEMTTKMELDDLVKEMDEFIEQYDNLKSFTALYEGSISHLDEGLSDDIIQSISEIQNRLKVIKKAKGLIDKLSVGGWEKGKVRRHLERLQDNKDNIMQAVKYSKAKLNALERKVHDLVGDIKPQDGLSYSES